MSKKRRKYVPTEEIEKLIDDKPNIKKIKDQEEWNELEDLYIDAVNSIEVPPDLRAIDILRVNADIDKVYSLARFDYSYVKNMKDHYDLKLANAKKTARLAFPKKKHSADDRDALITQYLEERVLKGDKEPLMALFEKWKARHTFMDAVIDTLLKKQGMMINGNGALKLDAQGRGDVDE